MEHHQDEHITCAECGTTFVFTAAEADSFASKRLDPPKRCPDCRRARRAQKAAEGRQDGPPPRGQFGGDVNGYRSPMSDPGASRGPRSGGGGGGEYRAPGFRDSRPSDGYRAAGRGGNSVGQGGNSAGQGGNSAGQGAGGRGEYRAPSFAGDRGPRGGGDYRAPAYGGDRAPRGGGEYRAPAYGGDRGPRSAGGGEYRAPSFGGDRGGPAPDRGPRGGAGFRGGSGAGAPAGGFGRGPGRPDDRRGPPPDRRGPAADRRGPPGEHRGAPHGGEGPAGAQGGAPRPARADRPSFPITCAQCGAASEVPFKPQEGREILCRDCYRAKKDAG